MHALLPIHDDNRVRAGFQKRQIIHARLFKLQIFLHRRFVRRKQQVNHLNAVGREKIFFAAEKNLYPHFGFRNFSQFLIGENIANAGEQKFFFIRLDDEVIRPAFHAPNDVLRVRKGRQQNDGDFFQRVVGFDALAQVIAAHVRQKRRADEHGRRMRMNGVQRLASGLRDRDAVAVTGQRRLQALRLGGMRLNNQNFYAGCFHA